MFDSVGRIHRGNYPWSVLLCGYLRRELHDDLDQLLRENIEAQNKTYVYTYDNAGNRTSKKTYAYTTANSLSSLTYTATMSVTFEYVEIGLIVVRFQESSELVWAATAYLHDGKVYIGIRKPHPELSDFNYSEIIIPTELSKENFLN